MGTLYIVGTPIGNLEDMSARALRVLGQVSLIASENPARTQRLLARYDIHTPMMRYTDAYERKKHSRMQAVLAALEEGDVALVSEAGMPGLADPGYELIAAALERGVPVVPIPGPTALAAALSVAGIPGRAFRLSWFSAAGDAAPAATCWPRWSTAPSPWSPTNRRTACWIRWPTWSASSATGQWPSPAS